MMDTVETVAHVSFLSCLARTFGVSPDNHSIGDEIAGQPHGSPGLSGVPDREPPPTSARIQPIDGDTIAVVRTSTPPRHGGGAPTEGGLRESRLAVDAASTARR